MENSCFYCQDTISETQQVHFVSFFHEAEEREETLCPSCYSEWLEGIIE